MPEPSLPPMWKPVSSPCCACTLITSTGTPSAAHTLLKLMPAAITYTSTSRGPMEGVETTSFWKASFGGPKRSRRIVMAYIRGGTCPSGGVSPTSYRSFVTVLMAFLRVAGRKKCAWFGVAGIPVPGR